MSYHQLVQLIRSKFTRFPINIENALQIIADQIVGQQAFHIEVLILVIKSREPGVANLRLVQAHGKRDCTTGRSARRNRSAAHGCRGGSAGNSSHWRE
eukprot:scaffold21364_cov135-Isochrysis_galbana.AAC.1